MLALVGELRVQAGRVAAAPRGEHLGAEVLLDLALFVFEVLLFDALFEGGFRLLLNLELIKLRSTIFWEKRRSPKGEVKTPWLK